MLKNFDYIDPLLAERIKSLELELQKLDLSRSQLTNNKRLLPATRNKLLAFQKQHEQNTKKMLEEQKSKLVDYIDRQTVILTKESKQASFSLNFKPNCTLNQSTRIDLSTDDSKSLETMSKTERNRKISSFMVQGVTNRELNPTKYGNKHRLKLKRLTKKIEGQQKLINMLVTWVKIYYERQQEYQSKVKSDVQEQTYLLKQQSSFLEDRCRQLEQQIQEIRHKYAQTSQSILDSHQKYSKVKQQNQWLKLQRKQLIMNARSCKKGQN